MLTFLPGWFTGLCSGWLILCRHVSVSHLTLALTSAAATDSLSHESWYRLNYSSLLSLEASQGLRVDSITKFLSKLENKSVYKRNSSAVCCEDTALLTAQDTRGQWSGPGDEADPASGLATVCTTALRGGGGRVTISHYNTHIPFPDFMPAHPRHKLQCSLQRP